MRRTTYRSRRGWRVPWAIGRPTGERAAGGGAVRRMPKDPRITLDMPKVAPRAADEYEDESPTQRGTHEAASTAKATSANRPLLTVLVGLNAGQVFALDRDETFIGRGRDADVVLDDMNVSRRHARIVRTEDGRYFLEDLRSANGIFLGGRRVERVELHDGDRV